MDKRLLESLRLGLPAFVYFYTVGSVNFWIPLYAKGLGWSYTLVTLLATVYFVAITPSNVLSGILADLTGRPSAILAVGMFLNALSTFLMPYTGDPYLLLALRAAQGVGLATSLPMAVGALSLLHGVTRGVGVSVVMQGLGMASGSLLGGVLVEHLGYEAMFHSASLLSLAAMAVAVGWGFPGRPPLGTGLLDALRRIPLRVLAVPASLVLRNVFASGVFAVVSIIFNGRLGLSLCETGVALAVNPVVQALAGVLSPGLVEKRPLAAYSLGLASTGAVFLVYLYAWSPWMVYSAQALLGAGFGVASVAGNIYIIRESPEEVRYTASSLFSFSFNLGWIVGTVIAGPVMDVYGVDTWMWVSVPGVVAASASAFLFARLSGGSSR